MSAKPSIELSIEKLKVFMKSKAYRANSIRLYHYYWNEFSLFAKHLEQDHFSQALVESFLDDNKKHNPLFKEEEKHYLRAMDLLTNYVTNHNISPAKKRLPPLSDEYQNLLNRYEQHIEALSESSCSIKTKKSRVRIFLLYLEKQNLHFEDFSHSHLLSFINHLSHHYAPQGRVNILYSIKKFLEFCVEQHILSKSYIEYIPHLPFNPKSTTPSIYSAEEIKKILSTVNRNDDEEKKVYVILLLLTTLGLRSSDIVHLKKDQINWQNKQLEFIQHKTQTYSAFPLSIELQISLMDYLKTRPKNNQYPELFLRSKAPMIPYSGTGQIYRIVSETIIKSGVEVNGRHKGPHALRHSLAHRFLLQKNTLPIIAKALGHASTKHTSKYLTIDINTLRELALEVPVHEKI